MVSGDEKLIKPDHRLYQILFDRYNIDPVESVFIDDSFANITSAKELGMTKKDVIQLVGISLIDAGVTGGQ